MPELAQWNRKDPIGERGGLNLYAFVLNNVINSVDFLGQFTLADAKRSICELSCGPGGPAYCMNPCRRGLVDKEIFAEWLRLEKSNKSWVKELPPCPKKLCISGSKAQNPNNKVWKNPSGANSEHKGAVYEMRSLPTAGGHANQCSYDKQGIIMTGIPAGGTADFVSHSFTSTGHFRHDLRPWWLAKKLYKQWEYYTVRPVVVEK